MEENKKFDDFRAYAQLLLASRIFNEYLETKVTLMAAKQLEKKGRPSGFPKGDVEPESFADAWIREHVVGGNSEWREQVFRYFIKLVVNYPNALKEGK